MSVTRLSRDPKRQLGQYFTPDTTAAAIVREVPLSPDSRILEPSFGKGAFIFPVVETLASALTPDEFRDWCQNNLYGCEIDAAAYDAFGDIWRARGFGPVPANLEVCDFFTWLPPSCDRTAAIDPRRYSPCALEQFDLIIGNPPFGGSIEPCLQDPLDAIFGVRNGKKIKKETYAFFIVKSVDLLKPGGTLVFICSDTLLTIPTMTGLRLLLQSYCDVRISEVPGTFSDTNQDMLLLTVTKQHRASPHITVFGKAIPLAEIEVTPNASWRVDTDMARYFGGGTLGDKMVATSGMTIGKNSLFVRQITNGLIEEPYDFALCEQKITVEHELARARLGKISKRRLQRLREMEAGGVTEKAIKWSSRETAMRVALPHPDYRHYNKACSQIIYSDPEWVVFWRDDGEYVYRFKKTGKWYLHGVGGKRYFGREGLSWALIASRLYARYLPAGYILDSGAPCAFLREGVEYDELFFILGWALTDLCNMILKKVLNHTRNIQSKDFERLPYPFWVQRSAKQQAVDILKMLLQRARTGERFSFKSEEVRALNRLYEWHDVKGAKRTQRRGAPRQLSFF